MNPIAKELSRIDLVSMRLLVDCVQFGSLSAAAEQAHVALPAASRRIKELERVAGEALFERPGRTLQATAAGRVFYRHAVGILQSIELLGTELTNMQLGSVTQVRLCASTAAISQSLCPILREYALEFPRVRIELEEQVSEAVVKSLREGRADVGVFVEVQETQGLDCQAFDHDELVFVIPHGHRLAGKEPLRFADALDENWISFTEGAALLQRQRQAAHAAGRVLKLCMQLRHRLPSGGRRHGDCHAAGGRRPDRAELEASPASGCRCVGHPQPHRRHPLGPPRSKHQFVGGVHRPKFAKSEASREKTVMDAAPARSQTRCSSGLANIESNA